MKVMIKTTFNNALQLTSQYIRDQVLNFAIQIIQSHKTRPDPTISGALNERQVKGVLDEKHYKRPRKIH